MYCLVLVSIYIVSTATWLATAHTRHYSKAEVVDHVFVDADVDNGLGLLYLVSPFHFDSFLN